MTTSAANIPVPTKPILHKASATSVSLIGGRTLDGWNDMWERLPHGLSVRHPHLRCEVGLLRTILNDEVVYLGRAIEYRNGGLTKRLADFCRASPSARNHVGAQKVFDHRDLLTIEVLPVGSDKAAAALTKQLHQAMLAQNRPRWNVRIPIAA